MMDNTKVLKSGEYLVEEIGINDVFIPEQFNEEQLMIAQTVQDFLDTEVYPNVDKIDKPDIDLMRETSAEVPSVSSLLCPKSLHGNEWHELAA